MRETLAIMLTMTTYGTWLRGDRRGWVESEVWFCRPVPNWKRPTGGG